MTSSIIHGGPDALGVPRFDFSTNANACGPAPRVVEALQVADATRYPDPQGTALRRALGDFHRVDAGRIVLAASASEFIRRMTLAISLRTPQAAVHAPSPGYGEYAQAASALGLRRSDALDADLVWHTQPGSPRGDSTDAPATRDGAVLVVDAAYEPLRLQGEVPRMPDHAWRLYSPNKALGLTGVRGAYAVAPSNAQSLCDSLAALAPSWPLGAHAVAMLGAWADPSTQAWLQLSCNTLRDWKRQQLARLRALGWTFEDSVVPFFVARWDAPFPPDALRASGIKLRDTTSMGLPGWVRLGVQSPDAQIALCHAWQGAAR